VRSNRTLRGECLTRVQWESRGRRTQIRGYDTLGDLHEQHSIVARQITTIEPFLVGISARDAERRQQIDFAPRRVAGLVQPVSVRERADSIAEATL
jgi:hypothetical protein